MAGPEAELISHLRQALGNEHVLTRQDDMAPHVVDWRGRHHGHAICVVLPSSTAEVVAIVNACAASGVPVVPQGGNTGLVAGAIPLGDAVQPPVVVALRRMNRILEIDPLGDTMTVQAGCILADVRQAAQERGRLYGVSFGAEGSCQIGGTIATNAGGTAVLRYGSTRENVLGLEVVLANGHVWNGLRALRKDNAGYAMRSLFVGAEGTLGIVTAATLRLHPLPRSWSTAWLTVDSVERALDCLGGLKEAAGDRITAFELLNRAQIENVLRHQPDLRSPPDAQAPFSVLAELADTGPSSVLETLMEQSLADFMERGWLRDAAIAPSAATREAMWRLRHGTAEANRREGMGLSADVAVPLSAVPRFIREASEAVRQVYPQAVTMFVSHLGDGNVHFTPMFRHADWQRLPDPAKVADEVRTRVHDVAHAVNGTFSAEHGVGRTLVGELLRLRSPEEIDLMRAVRRALDPSGLFNPGAVFTHAPARQPVPPPAS
ncbi:FAD-binding oxidoreductase [Hydrogenophaga sp.]|jgi:FAD/FMN-containing dehydrogenase|uniref:FAD-binding oxidoreductase n=1 Tax=Hydrogenophaga sp. TaxID=1904254 RepID=UPI003F709224